MYRTLISAAQLAALGTEQSVLVDCRHQLSDVDYGRRVYVAGHIPHAFFLSLDEHLSGLCTGRNGRHPLPAREHLAEHLSTLGIGANTQVVAYDDVGGMFAARLWWLLRWLGHEAVAVLDGGIAAWQAQEGALSADTPVAQPQHFVLRASLGETVDVEQVLANLERDEFLVIDARGATRYAGQDETIDPIGGHIPGALNRPFMHNLTAEGHFKSAADLRAEWQTLLAGRNRVVHQCGSGVTACMNVLAMEHAGLNGSYLYPGSWSEWCADPARPIAQGVQPR